MYVLNLASGVLIGREPCEDTQGRPWDEGDRDQTDVAINQETPRITGSHWKLGSDEEECSVVLSPQFMVICNCNPKKLTYHPIQFHSHEEQALCLATTPHEDTVQVIQVPSLSTRPPCSFPPLVSGSRPCNCPFSRPTTKPGSFKTSLKAPALIRLKQIILGYPSASPLIF